MRLGKLIKTIATGVILTCCGLTAVLMFNDNESSQTERPAFSATQATATKRATAIPLPQVKVAVSSANIRSGPGTNYPATDIALEDETYPVIASNNAQDWYIIKLDNREFGWIAASVVTAVNSLTAVEIAETIPAPPANQPPASQPTSAPVPQSTAPPPSLVCDCSGDRYNCSSFGSSGQAQACFNYCIQQGRGDIHRLDGDNDGRACE